MNANVALSNLASCGTRQIWATLVRRVHRLLMVLLQKHIMPMGVAIFKPLPQFHPLVGLYLQVKPPLRNAPFRALVKITQIHTTLRVTV